MERVGIVDAVAQHYVVLVLDALHRTGVLAAMHVPAGAAELGCRCGLSGEMLGALLNFAAAGSTVVERRGDGRFALAGDLGFIAHMLDQYVGGYGPPLHALADLLRDGRTGESLVDLQRHADAFGKPGPLSEAGRLVLDLGVTGVVEIGCGGGQALCALAEASPELTAFGIDANPAVVAKAAARIEALGLSSRATVRAGDAIEVLAETSGEGVQVVLAASMLNAMWRHPGGVATFVRRLAALLPGRLLVVSDYYSHLAGDKAAGTARTLLHDVAQIVTGQGLPPNDVCGWATEYEAAGASLLQALEASGDGIDRFVHLVKLPG